MKKMIPYFIVAILTASLAFSGPVAAASGVTERVSVSTTGIQAEGRSHQPSVSADGHFVAFVSEAGNLVSDDTNGQMDVFVHDRQKGTTSRVSISSSGKEGNDASMSPSISADGRYVAFFSYANNLVEGDTNGVADVFVHDRQTGTTTRVSISTFGEEGNNGSSSPAISADGYYIAFVSNASNLVAGDTNWVRDVFVHDRQSGETKRVSLSSAGKQADNWSQDPSISADGRYVAFISYATNLVEGDSNGRHDVFVKNLVTGITTRVSVSTTGQQGNNISLGPSISSDGRYIAFYSYASNLVTGDTNSGRDIFVHDRVTTETKRVSVSGTGVQGNHDSYGPFISANGNYVTFASLADNLVAGDTNGHPDVFVVNRLKGEIQRVSVSSSGEQGDSWSQGEIWQGQPVTSVISADGNYVAFTSAAGNLVNDDSNQMEDIYVYQRAFDLVDDNVSPITTTSLQGTPGQNNWYLSNVTVSFTAVDNQGGQGVSRTEYSLNGTHWINYQNPFIIQDEGITTLYYRSVDKAGNIESPKVETIMIDKTVPLVSNLAPIDGSEYILGDRVVANWAANDEISGIASAEGTIPSGETIDAASTGIKTLTITAVDKAGNQVTRTITYTVRYAFGGILEPIDNKRTFNLGGTIPVKFQLRNAGANLVTNAVARIYLAKLEGGVHCGEAEAVSSGDITDHLFTYDSLENQYFFHLATKQLSTGSWQITIFLDDGSKHAAIINLR